MTKLPILTADGIPQAVALSDRVHWIGALDPGLPVPDEAALNDLSSALARAFQKGVRS